MAKSIKLSFPLLGVDRNWAVSEQPGLTTPEAENVRPYDVIRERARGGPRPALRKRFSQQIGSAAKRIDALCQVAVGYVTASDVSLTPPIPPGETPGVMTWSADFFANGGYGTGTISITQTGTTVTLVGGVWPAWAATNGVLVYNGIEYAIASRTDDTHIELSAVWALTTISGVAYVLWHDGEPATIDTVSIVMVATTITADDGVEYYFANVTDPTHDSGWQDSPVFLDNGLTPATAYTYKVRGRDKSPTQNTTNWSAEKSATTATVPADVTPPTYTPAANGMWVVTPYAYLGAGNFYYHRMVAVECTDADNPPVQYMFVALDGVPGNSGWLTRAAESGTKEYINGPFLVPNPTTYRVDVKDGAGNIISSTKWNTMFGLIG